jgi:hypothetical protein
VPCTFLRMRLCTCRRFVFFDEMINMKPVLGRSSLVVGQTQDFDIPQIFLAESSWPTTIGQRPTTVYFAPVLPTFFFKRSPE